MVVARSDDDKEKASAAKVIELAPRLAARLKAGCPRCEAPLMTNYDEAVCPQCGYVDYAYTPGPARCGSKSIMSAATMQVLRYIGDSPGLSQVLTHVQLQRMRNRIGFRVTCPFCSRQMTQSSLSGRRRERREERYKCPDGHRVSLIPRKDGSLGWK
ncbi:MAG: hypothetical protein L0177_00955 [Chloroflexi bacterium]|nr:hypothetical protein [Chloroflexota bacterium]